MNILSNVLKKTSTLIVNYKPQSCPACHCPRFEKVKLSIADRTLGRKARYRCLKCGIATLQVPLSDTPLMDRKRGKRKEKERLQVSQQRLQNNCDSFATPKDQ